MKHLVQKIYIYILNQGFSGIRTLKLKTTTIMDPKTRKLGGSLKVPFVQELAKENPSSVPTRYIRPGKDQYPTISNGGSFHQIPVVDMQSFPMKIESVDDLIIFYLNFTSANRLKLINHEVSSSLVEKLKSEVQDFFNLPMAEKNKYGQEPGDVEGYGQAFVKSEEQKLDWADMLYMITQPEDLRKPHLFPKLPLPLRESLQEYSIELKSLALKILNLIAKALGMKHEEIEVLLEEGLQSMRLTYFNLSWSQASAITLILLPSPFYFKSTMYKVSKSRKMKLGFLFFHFLMLL
ncbi:unnamed protein product [Coffea canephora]|uniref:DH200=94 genomic scaffold, scaffold_3239 n=1 Tax=Coffea canephora TaxID=49390 RepID=A0A068VKR6_COFCA|nr:unnamed protein product [Coffea canephora]